MDELGVPYLAVRGIPWLSEGVLRAGVGFSLTQWNPVLYWPKEESGSFRCGCLRSQGGGGAAAVAAESVDGRGPVVCGLVCSAFGLWFGTVRLGSPKGGVSLSGPPTVFGFLWLGSFCEAA